MVGITYSSMIRSLPYGDSDVSRRMSTVLGSSQHSDNLVVRANGRTLQASQTALWTSLNLSGMDSVVSDRLGCMKRVLLVMGACRGEWVVCASTST